MQRLTHILKLIFLGPQPKDELYEEWSKDPLAEWFREQRRLDSTASSLERVRRFFLDDWWITGLSVLLCIGFFLLKEPFRGLLMMLWLPFMILLFVGWKDRGVGSRPPVRFGKLFRPAIRVQSVLDLWIAGMRGSDIAKLLYVEQRWGMDARSIAGLLFVNMSLVPFIVSGNWVLLGFTAILAFAWFRSLLRFIFYSSQNPFATMDWPHLVRGIPGHRALRLLAFRAQKVRGHSLPLWPIFFMPVICWTFFFLVAQSIVPPIWLYAAIGGPLVISILLMHSMAQALNQKDARLLEQAFLLADRDFDQWVRKELIGDEDARGT